jgi:hypothetical protein
MRIFLAVMLSLALWGCGSDADYTLGHRQWGDVVIEVQSRPAPVAVGMNEFLIIATDTRGGPVHDLLVELRMNDNESWRQAIQDGFSGVYRKALAVDSLQDQLQIKLKRGTTETALRFPVSE